MIFSHRCGPDYRLPLKPTYQTCGTDGYKSLCYVERSDANLSSSALMLILALVAVVVIVGIALAAFTEGSNVRT